MGSNRLEITLLLRTLEPASRMRATRYLPVLCTGYVVRELRRARQDFGEDSAMTDEPERFTGRWLPADLVHIWGTDGDDQRLERGADWELLNRGSVLPYTVVLHVCSLLAKSPVC